jgi:hypothetical protein
MPWGKPQNRNFYTGSLKVWALTFTACGYDIGNIQEFLGHKDISIIGLYPDFRFAPLRIQP